MYSIWMCHNPGLSLSVIVIILVCVWKFCPLSTCFCVKAENCLHLDVNVSVLLLLWSYPYLLVMSGFVSSLRLSLSWLPDVSNLVSLLPRSFVSLYMACDQFYLCWIIVVSCCVVLCLASVSYLCWLGCFCLVFGLCICLNSLLCYLCVSLYSSVHFSFE